MSDTMITQPPGHAILDVPASAIWRAHCEFEGVPIIKPSPMTVHRCQQLAAYAVHSLNGLATGRARLAAGLTVRDLAAEYSVTLTDSQATALAAAAITCYEMHLDGTHREESVA